MIGASRITGQPLSGDAHLAQSIVDILTTPIGTRVLRRDYGSRVPQLIDAPLNGSTVVEVYGAIAEALDKWEPRVRLDRVVLTDASRGQIEVELQGRYRTRTDDAGVVIEGADDDANWVLPIKLGAKQ